MKEVRNVLETWVTVSKTTANKPRSLLLQDSWLQGINWV